MARAQLRREENVAGDFFVDATCIDCDLCRQLAPGIFASAGDQSAVIRQPGSPAEESAALFALVTCPTASIGAAGAHAVREAAGAFPLSIEDEVHFCGYASEDTYGASSYLVARPAGNVLVDSPRFASPLVRRIEGMGGIRWIFLTHRDDVAGHEKWARHFGAERILHREDAAGIRGIERLLEGRDPIRLEDDLLVLPTPGHTRGHCALLFRDRFLFSGDHLWATEDEAGLGASRSVCWYSWPEQIRSMERLLEHGFCWVLPGHGRRFHATRARMAAELREAIRRMKARAA